MVIFRNYLIKTYYLPTLKTYFRLKYLLKTTIMSCMRMNHKIPFTTSLKIGKMKILDSKHSLRLLDCIVEV
jgi:hypothetical protein